MKKLDKSFSLTPLIIFRLFLFVLVYLLVVSWLTSSNSHFSFSLGQPASNLVSSVASSAAQSLGISHSLPSITDANNILSGQSLSSLVATATAQVKSFLNSQFKLYQRQLIDKIYQDLTKPSP